MTELEEKRVMLAKDALAKVGSRQWEAVAGTAGDFKTYGCVGGCLVACEGKTDWLESIFAGHLSTIGKCYDGWDGMTRWIKSIPDPTQRFIAILQNIVRNSGTFIPTDIQPIEPTINTLDFKTSPACIADLREIVEAI